MSPTDLTPDHFLAALRSLLPERGPDGCPAAYPLHEPQLGAPEKALLAECIDSTFVSSVGQYVERLERELEQLTGARRAVVVVNGTAALKLSLLLAGVRPGDLVICPALTFVATANAIAHLGATPCFVDVEAESLGLDPVCVSRFLTEHCAPDGSDQRHRASGARIGAILLVHIFGHPARAAELGTIAQEHGLPLVEDAAESLAAWEGETHTGLTGLTGALSFNGNKLVTTGGGGAILTMSEEVGARAKHLSTTAKRPHRWAYTHDEVGFNDRMPNLNAALGCAQLGRLPTMLEQKRRLHLRWVNAFHGSEVLILPPRPGTRSNHWLNAAVLPAGTPRSGRDAILDAVCDAGIYCRPIWAPLHTLPMYATAPRTALPVTEDLADRVINLPSSAHLADLNP